MDESTIAFLLRTAELYRGLGAVLGALVGLAIVGLLAHFKITYPGHRVPLWLILLGGIGHSIFEILTYTTFNILPNTCAAAKEILSHEDAGFAYPCQREGMSRKFGHEVAAWEILAARWISIAILAAVWLCFANLLVLGFLFAERFLATVFGMERRDVKGDAEKGEGEWIAREKEDDDCGFRNGEGSILLY